MTNKCNNYIYFILIITIFGDINCSKNSITTVISKYPKISIGCACVVLLTGCIYAYKKYQSYQRHLEGFLDSFIRYAPPPKDYLDYLRKSVLSRFTGFVKEENLQLEDHEGACFFGKNNFCKDGFNYATVVYFINKEVEKKADLQYFYGAYKYTTEKNILCLGNKKEVLFIKNFMFNWIQSYLIRDYSGIFNINGEYYKTKEATMSSQEKNIFKFMHKLIPLLSIVTEVWYTNGYSIKLSFWHVFSKVMHNILNHYDSNIENFLQAFFNFYEKETLGEKLVKDRDAKFNKKTLNQINMVDCSFNGIPINSNNGFCIDPRMVNEDFDESFFSHSQKEFLQKFINISPALKFWINLTFLMNDFYLLYPDIYNSPGDIVDLQKPFPQIKGFCTAEMCRKFQENLKEVRDEVSIYEYSQCKGFVYEDFPFHLLNDNNNKEVLRIYRERWVMQNTLYGRFCLSLGEYNNYDIQKDKDYNTEYKKGAMQLKRNLLKIDSELEGKLKKMLTFSAKQDDKKAVKGYISRGEELIKAEIRLKNNYFNSILPVIAYHKGITSIIKEETPRINIKELLTDFYY